MSATIDPIDVNATLSHAVAAHQSGQLDRAAELYRQCVDADPTCRPGLYYGGVLALQQSRAALAVRLLQSLSGLEPHQAEVWYHLGLAQQQCGRAVDAEHAYRNALARNPLLANAGNNLGLLLRSRGACAEAVAVLRGVVQADPAPAEHWMNLGLALHDAGDLLAAVDCYRRAERIEPDARAVLLNLGGILSELGDHAGAIQYLQRAVLLFPDQAAKAHVNIGAAYDDMGDYDAAASAYRSALSLDPDNASAMLNFGNVLKEQGKLVDAESRYRRALAIDPGFAEAECALGNLLKDKGALDAAIGCYQRALAIRPHYTEAYSNLLYLHAFTRDIPPQQECTLAAGWEKIALTVDERATAQQRFAGPHRKRLGAGRWLKIGIVSAEIGQHAVADFLEPLLQHLDRQRFHVTLFPTHLRPEARAARLRALADEFTPLVGLPDSRAAEQIRSAGIDVLIDTTSHMNGCRLGIFAHRAAPVQCHYIGYHGTTGLSEMDWFIADGTLLPPSCDAHFREKIWRLPRLWVAYRGDDSLAESRWTPSENGVVWLGTFNNLTKVREQSLRLWARVMHALPTSRLLLKDRKAIDPEVQKRLTAGLARCGINADRVEFAAWTSSWNAHMALYDRLDIALDTIPLNSGTTAFDALWMGVPLVALEGDWMGGRMTSAMLTSLGKHEWIARDESDYVARVAALAGNVEARTTLRKHQRTLMKKSPLCDAAGLARALEDAFEAMFDHGSGAPPTA